MFYPKDLIGLVILFNSHGSVALLIMLIVIKVMKI